MRSRLAAVLLAVGVVVGLSTAAHAAQSGNDGSRLFAGNADVTVAACTHDGDATALAVLTSSSFDDGSPITFQVHGTTGITATGDTVGATSQWPVAIHVAAGTPAGDYTVGAVAGSYHHGAPAAVSDYVHVHVGC